MVTKDNIVTIISEGVIIEVDYSQPLILKFTIRNLERLSFERTLIHKVPPNTYREILKETSEDRASRFLRILVFKLIKDIPDITSFTN